MHFRKWGLNRAAHCHRSEQDFWACSAEDAAPGPRMAEAGKDLWSSSGPSLLLKQSPRVRGQDCVQIAFEYFQGWRILNPLGQPRAVLSHPQLCPARSSDLHQPWKAWDRDRSVREIKFTPSAPPSQAKAGAETAHGLWSISKQPWI